MGIFSSSGFHTKRSRFVLLKAKENFMVINMLVFSMQLLYVLILGRAAGISFY